MSVPKAFRLDEFSTIILPCFTGQPMAKILLWGSTVTEPSTLLPSIEAPLKVTSLWRGRVALKVIGVLSMGAEHGRRQRPGEGAIGKVGKDTRCKVYLTEGVIIAVLQHVGKCAACVDAYHL